LVRPPRTSRYTCLPLLATLCLVPASCADEHECETLTGTFASNVVPDCQDSPVRLCTSGRLAGGFEGDYYFVFQSFGPHPSDPGKQTYTGVSKITTRAGVIETDDTGVLDGSPEQTAGFVTTAEIARGTGAHEEARGTFVATGTLQRGAAEGTYEAKLCGGK
jgi:hypothetical protein